MRPINWGRVFTAMVTPFNSKQDVDYDVARTLAEYLVDSGSDGLVVAGTTGESPALSGKEKLKLFETVLDAVGDRATILAGTGSNGHADTVKLTKDAEKVGVHGVMLVTPYYNKPPQGGLVEHFRRVADSTALPVLLYNVPPRTGVNLLPASVQELSEVPNIVALKDASGDLEQTTETLRRVPDDFLVYSGEDSLTLPMVSVGGYGVVSVAAHVAGQRIKDMIDRAVAGDTAEAASDHRELFPLFKAVFVTTNPIPVKAAVQMLGLDVGDPRLPLVPASPAERDVLRDVMESLGFID